MPHDEDDNLAFPLLPPTSQSNHRTFVLSLPTVSCSSHGRFLHLHGEAKTKGEELLARAESNGYKKGHAERRTVAETKKMYTDKAKDQRAALDLATVRFPSLLHRYKPRQGRQNERPTVDSVTLLSGFCRLHRYHGHIDRRNLPSF